MGFRKSKEKKHDQRRMGERQKGRPGRAGPPGSRKPPRVLEQSDGTGQTGSSKCGLGGQGRKVALDGRAVTRETSRKSPDPAGRT